MSNYAIGWILYACGVLPAAMLALWAARKDDGIHEAHKVPIAMLLALFWPGILVMLGASFLAAAIWMLSDPRMWWALGYAVTRPFYRLHMWVGARLVATDDRIQAAERDSAKE